MAERASFQWHASVAVPASSSRLHWLGITNFSRWETLTDCFGRKIYRLGTIIILCICTPCFGIGSRVGKRAAWPRQPEIYGTYVSWVLFLYLLSTTSSSTAKFRELESQASFAATRKHCVRRIGSLLFLAKSFQLGCDPEVVASTVLYISSFIFV